MDKNLNTVKFYGINDALNDLGQYQALVLNSKEGTTVPVKQLSEFDYIKQYVYRLKADNEALNLVVNTLTAKEEKQEDKDNKWIKFKYGKNNEYIGLTKVNNIDWFEHTNEYICMYLKNNEDSEFILSKESYNELSELLVGNKEKQNV